MDANDLEHASKRTVEEGQGHDGSLTEGVLAGQTRSESFWTLHHAAEKLRVEHAAISAAIDRGSVAVRSAAEDPGGVEDAREAVLKLLQQLIRHRQRGADLVYEAYNVDIEAGD